MGRININLDGFWITVWIQDTITEMLFQLISSKLT